MILLAWLANNVINIIRAFLIAALPIYSLQQLSQVAELSGIFLPSLYYIKMDNIFSINSLYQFISNNLIIFIAIYTIAKNWRAALSSPVFGFIAVINFSTLSLLTIKYWGAYPPKALALMQSSGLLAIAFTIAAVIAARFESKGFALLESGASFSNFKGATGSHVLTRNIGER